MTAPFSTWNSGTTADPQAEIARLNKVVHALMNRAERSMSLQQRSGFNLFQATIVLEAQVKRRTQEVEAALRENEKITRELRSAQEKLREQAIRDPLTGLYNRRYMDETLGREIARVERLGRSLSVIMGDIDHFKSVNDRYGHQAGDKVLKAFGELFIRNTRTSDIQCRFGGEEFLLVLPEMTGEQACLRAELLRAAFAELSVGYGDSEIRVTASFGVAEFPRDGHTSDELIAAADGALYAAKDAGRNRVSRAQGGLGHPRQGDERAVGEERSVGGEHGAHGG